MPLSARLVPLLTNVTHGFIEPAAKFLKDLHVSDSIDLFIQSTNKLVAVVIIFSSFQYLIAIFLKDFVPFVKVWLIQVLAWPRS